MGGPRSSREVKGGHYETRQGQTFLMTRQCWCGAGLRFENDMLDVFELASYIYRVEGSDAPNDMSASSVRMWKGGQGH